MVCVLIFKLNVSLDFYLGKNFLFIFIKDPYLASKKLTQTKRECERGNHQCNQARVDKATTKDNSNNSFHYLSLFTTYSLHTTSHYNKIFTHFFCRKSVTLRCLRVNNTIFRWNKMKRAPAKPQSTLKNNKIARSFIESNWKEFHNQLLCHY